MKYTQKYINKLNNLCQFDLALLETLPDNALIIGADEVGRGSAIGPVVAAAACFTKAQLQNPHQNWVGLDDSKASYHNHPSRSQLVEGLRETVCHAIAQATQAEVEQLNVSQASLLASKRAILACYQQLGSPNVPVLVLLDGKTTLKQFDLPNVTQKAIVKGDGQSASIAAAANFAKVYRDNWVLGLCKDNPKLKAYGFETNMGYLTVGHRQAIAELGLTPYHRKTFSYEKTKQLALRL